MSSASSTARCIDCTVDSMLTTTPFFSPREGWLPMPMISSVPSVLISPTIATTLLVPISRPTIKFRSERLAIEFPGPLGRRRGRSPRRARCARRTPPDREAVGVAHVDVIDVGLAMRDHLRGRAQEAIDPRIDVAPPEAHRHAADQIDFPG